MWSYLPKNIQLCLWQKSTEDIEQYANMYQFIPLRAYVIFCPPVHILDMIFLLLSIIGVILEFTLLRRATSTDEVSVLKFLNQSITVNSYSWCIFDSYCVSFCLFMSKCLPSCVSKTDTCWIQDASGILYFGVVFILLL